jgi:3-methylcrotonyl-CoA carboxylase alpha subunit
VMAGSEIGVTFDPMLSKLICYAATRDECIDRLDRALRDYIILGTKTNVSWLRRVVTHPAFREGLVSTRFLADHESELKREIPEIVPLLAAALSAATHKKGEQRPTTGDPRPTSVWDTLGSWGR